MNLFSYILIAALVAGLILDYWLLLRHRKHVSAHRQQVPEAFQQDVTLEQHQKAASYTLAKTSVTLWELPFGALMLLLWLGGGVQFLATWLDGFGLQPLINGTLLILLVTLLSSIAELPFSLYRTFRVETRFGFNRTSLKRFSSDLLLQSLLMLIMGGALVWVILWIMASLGEWWWLAGWAAWMSFSLMMMWLFPTVIAPLFNKFTPLDDGELKSRIQNLLERNQFRSKGVFVMDGSRRSSHGNAYFTGFGDAKRIVFFDTLLTSLTDQEVEAVLAHELGHYKHKHIRNMLITSSLVMLSGFFIVGLAITQDWFYAGIGATELIDNQAAGLLLILLVLPLFTRFLQPMMSIYQRKHEFEADEFASQQTGAAPLIQALVKLYRENASTLTPDPLYSAFHDSHPPASIRIAHLAALSHRT